MGNQTEKHAVTKVEIWQSKDGKHLEIVHLKFGQVTKIESFETAQSGKATKSDLENYNQTGFFDSEEYYHGNGYRLLADKATRNIEVPVEAK